MSWSEEYRFRSLKEYARGACDCALMRGVASHVIIYSNTEHAEGGMYVCWSEVEFGESIEDVLKKDETQTGVTRRKIGKFRIVGSLKGKMLKVVDLSISVDDQIEDIEDIYNKVNGKPFTPFTKKSRSY